MRCIFCGRNAGTTKDHVPPKSLLRKPYPADLLTVPSCGACNNGFSKNEEYFRLIVVGLMCHTPEAEQLFDGSMSRSMNRNTNMEELMFGALQPAGTAVILDADYSRIFRIADKIARGLEFLTTGVAYPIAQKFHVEFAEVQCGSSKTAYGPDFTYQRPSNVLNGWEFTFFDSVRFLVQVV